MDNISTVQKIASVIAQEVHDGTIFSKQSLHQKKSYLRMTDLEIKVNFIPLLKDANSIISREQGFEVKIPTLELLRIKRLGDGYMVIIDVPRIKIQQIEIQPELTMTINDAARNVELDKIIQKTILEYFILERFNKTFFLHSVPFFEGLYLGRFSPKGRLIGPDLDPIVKKLGEELIQKAKPPLRLIHSQVADGRFELIFSSPSEKKDTNIGLEINKIHDALQEMLNERKSILEQSIQQRFKVDPMAMAGQVFEGIRFSRWEFIGEDSYDIWGKVRNSLKYSNQLYDAQKMLIMNFLLRGDFSEPVVQDTVQQFKSILPNNQKEEADKILRKSLEQYQAMGTPDKAVLTQQHNAFPGGIDLSQQDAALRVTKDANGGVKVDVDPALIARVEREGMPEVVPVIINMQPADIRSLFGVEGKI
jgi:hypothetical protein